ncbi:Uroporphyrinogen-III synthase [Streptococcus sp. DD11]|uniref:uroporphyrinogen-III synthase n=1 Tax=Streptococcus sp. DD11 TaxID=1777879 RepID=UPI000798142D|nr:uroporphyrinogen-III synthase [Streptococcus sp. DD11]KXT85881.1 Uroporphyrinogen-III synthase [Streptococcus sp. DD11]
MVKKLIFTREQAPDSVWLEKIKQAGFEPHHVPLIRCQTLALPESIKAVLPAADWVFFTSAVAVEAFSPYLRADCQIATIGPRTSRALDELDRACDFQASSHYGADFVQEWLALALPAQKILLPQSSLSNPSLAEALKEAGHEVWAWPMYQTTSNLTGQKQLENYLSQEDVIWTFASPSAWQSFCALKPQLPSSHQIAVIGQTTAQAVKESGYRVDCQPQRPSVEEMVKEIIKKEEDKHGIL